MALYAKQVIFKPINLLVLALPCPHDLSSRGIIIYLQETHPRLSR